MSHSLKRIILLEALAMLPVFCSAARAQSATVASGPSQTYLITKTPATGSWDGMSFALYDMEFSSGEHTLVYGPLMSFQRERVPNVGVRPILRLAQNSEWCEILVDVWPPDEVVAKYQEKFFGGNKSVLGKAPRSRLPLQDVSFTLSYLGEIDPSTGHTSEKTLGSQTINGPWDAHDPLAIRFHLEPGIFANGALVRGGLQLRWRFHFPTKTTRLQEYARISVRTLLSAELNKKLIPAQDERNTPITDIAVFAENEGSLRRDLVRSAQLITSPFLSADRETVLVARLEGMLPTLSSEEAALTLNGIPNRHVALYFEGLEATGKRFGLEILNERLTAESTKRFTQQLDEALEKLYTDKDAHKWTNEQLHDKLRHELDVHGKASASVMVFFSGGMSVDYRELRDEDKEKVNQELNKLREVYNSDKTSRKFTQSFEDVAKTGEILREIIRAKRSKLIVYNLERLAGQVEFLTGSEVIEEKPESLTKVDTFTTLAEQQNEPLSPLDSYYEVPVGTMLPFVGLKDEVKGSYFFQLCDGSELPSDSPLRAQGLKTTPDMRERFLRGVGDGGSVMHSYTPVGETVETSADGKHSHTLPDHTHATQLRSYTGTVANPPDDAPPSHLDHHMKLGAGGGFGMNQFATKPNSPGHPNTDGQHVHDVLPVVVQGVTWTDANKQTGEEKVHSHTLARSSLLPGYVEVHWIMRVR